MAARSTSTLTSTPFGGNPGIAKLLLEADPETLATMLGEHTANHPIDEPIDPDGLTLAHIAAATGHAALTQALKDAGANLGAETTLGGRTPEIEARRQPCLVSAASVFGYNLVLGKEDHPSPLDRHDECLAIILAQAGGN